MMGEQLKTDWSSLRVKLNNLFNDFIRLWLPSKGVVKILQRLVNPILQSEVCPKNLTVAYYIGMWIKQGDQMIWSSPRAGKYGKTMCQPKYHPLAGDELQSYSTLYLKKPTIHQLIL